MKADRGLAFRTLFVSAEATHCPTAGDLCAAARWLATLGAESGSVSVRYGNRVVINVAGAPLPEVGQEDLVEIADYDAARNTMVLIGRAEPSLAAPLHWLIHRWRPDVNAVVQAALPSPSEARDGVLSIASDVPPPREVHVPEAPRLPPVVERSQSALRGLRLAPVTYAGSFGYVALGAVVEQAKQRLGEALQKGRGSGNGHGR